MELYGNVVLGLGLGNRNDRIMLILLKSKVNSRKINIF